MSSPLLRMSRHQSALILLPDGGGLTVAEEQGQEVRVSASQGACALLVAGCHDMNVFCDAPAQVRAPSRLQCLLGFHDHAAGHQRRAPVGPSASMVLQVLDDGVDGVEAWWLGQLAGKTAILDRIGPEWEAAEAYRIVRFVLANPSLNVQQMAARYGLSVAQFRRLASSAFGGGLKERMRLLRAGRALQLRVDTGASFTTVAHELGFASASHFCCEIKSLLGHAPRTLFSNKYRI